MMLSIVLFNVVLFLSCGYAAWRGGTPERAVAALMFIAALATFLTPWSLWSSFRAVEWATLWIDLTLFAGIAGVALFADRFWPVWVAALQLITIASHGVRAFDSRLWALSYWLILGKIAYPMLILLVIGTVRHRERLRAGLPEADWSRHERGDLARPGGDG